MTRESRDLKVTSTLGADDVSWPSLACCCPVIEQDLSRFVLAELDLASTLLIDTLINGVK